MKLVLREKILEIMNIKLSWLYLLNLLKELKDLYNIMKSMYLIH
jgi:hypothetical protein